MNALKLYFIKIIKKKFAYKHRFIRFAPHCLSFRESNQEGRCFDYHQRMPFDTRTFPLQAKHFSGSFFVH